MNGDHADPLHRPRGGCETYAVHIYNRDVRARVKENRPHHILSERWAEEQTHEVVAHDEREARAMAERRFPSTQGFVITTVSRAHQ
ncbi:hypothetical protein ACM64Y_13455 [Novispirillum sp. DQ9]|uniref:hypothetical protein n=1 Tax=Novispirillum sp. DQ9 TaxID=3398612 RepID=UPI003C7A7135